MVSNGSNPAPGADRVGHVIVAARNESERIAETVTALKEAFPSATVIVADDGSDDDTASRARAAGAIVVSTGEHLGKGQAASLAAQRALADGPSPTLGERPVVLLADADLAGSAMRLTPLARAVADREADLSVAAFARRVGGGFGLAVGFAHWAIIKRCGLDTIAPISGQRAISYQALAAVTPFHDGFGMEIGMTVDAVRAKFGLVEIELDLEHRATGRSLGGFIHRGRQLRDFMRTHRELGRSRRADRKA